MSNIPHSHILAWCSFDEAANPETVFAAEKETITTPLGVFQKLSHMVLKPGCKDKRFTEEWLGEQVKRLFDDIKFYNASLLSPKPEIAFSQIGSVHRAEGRFFLYLARLEIARLENEPTIFSYPQIEEIRKNAVRLFGRAEDVTGAPDHNTALDIARIAANCAALRRQISTGENILQTGEKIVMPPQKLVLVRENISPKPPGHKPADYVN